MPSKRVVRADHKQNLARIESHGGKGLPVSKAKELAPAAPDVVIKLEDGYTDRQEDGHPDGQEQCVFEADGKYRLRELALRAHATETKDGEQAVAEQVEYAGAHQVEQRLLLVEALEGEQMSARGRGRGPAGQLMLREMTVFEEVTEVTNGGALPEPLEGAPEKHPHKEADAHGRQFFLSRRRLQQRRW